jgi:diguanylate cyclase (GGDEF)-like protein
VRVAIATTPFDIGTSEPLSITASLGVAVSDGTDPQNLVGRADAALYEAKRSGRDRVCVA